MALKAVLDSLDGVDDAVQAFYAEIDGNFVLDIEGIDDHPGVRNLKSSYDGEKAKRKTAGEKIKALEEAAKGIPEDFDLDAWQRFKSGDTDKAAIEAAKVEVRRQLEGERDQFKAMFEKERGQTRALRTDSVLTEALAGAGITDPGLAEGARAVLLNNISYREEDGSPYFATDMGEFQIGEYVTKWAAEKGKAFVTPPKGADSKTTSAPGGSGGAPKSWGDAKTPQEKAAVIKARRSE